FLFVSSSSWPPPALPSFPTRRSSDLGEERDRLVERALHVELDLGMLVRGAEGLDRRGPAEHLGARAVVALAEALRPELTEPIGDGVEAVAVGHHDVDRRTRLGVGQVLEGGEKAARAAPQLIRGAPLLHGPRAL